MEAGLFAGEDVGESPLFDQDDGFSLSQSTLEPEIPVVPDELPDPGLWRILVVSAQPRQMSKGGIALAGQTIEAEESLNYLGQIIAIGPLAGHSEKYKLPDGSSAWDYKVGELILFSRHAGQKCDFKGIKLLFLNDDEILGRTSSLKGYRIYAG